MVFDSAPTRFLWNCLHEPTACHFRQVVLENSTGDEEGGTAVPSTRVHNSLTTDGVSMPVYAKPTKHNLHENPINNEEDHQVQNSHQLHRLLWRVLKHIN